MSCQFLVNPCYYCLGLVTGFRLVSRLRAMLELGACPISC